MQGGEQLQQHEDDPGKSKGARQSGAALDRADETAHRDGEQRRQEPAAKGHQPPQQGQAPVRLRQDGEELPFVAVAQSGEHGRNHSPFAARPSLGPRGSSDCDTL